MKTIIYRKSDLRCVGTIQPNTTFEWELEYNVIPNFGGTVSDYDSIETDLPRFKLQLIDNQVQAIEDLPTTDEKKSLLRPVRNQLLNDTDIIYCNPDKWELMSESTKTAWRTYKQKLKDWEDVDLDLGTFPSKPE